MTLTRSDQRSDPVPAPQPTRLRQQDAFRLSGMASIRRIMPARIASDVIGKPWMEGAVPVVAATFIALIVFMTTPHFGQASDRDLILIYVSELGFLAIAETVVLVGGGIDLSVGAMMGVGAMQSITLFRVFNAPVPVIVIAAVASGIVLGAINGFLIGFVKMRPFITTLITALSYRSLISVIHQRYSTQLINLRADHGWDMIGQGRILGLRTELVLFLVILVLAHICLTRMKWGWWITAVGSDRRSARRNGINPNRVAFGTYVLSGLLCSLAGLLYAARQGNTSDQLALNYEIAALTAVVLGGVSLTGGRGSVLRATLGLIVVAFISQYVIDHDLSGSWNIAILAAALLVVAALDAKWGKYRQAMTKRLGSVRPNRSDPGPLIDMSAPGPWQVNAGLETAITMGGGLLDGPEDIAVHPNGDVFCGDRRGWIWRLPEGNPSRPEVFARTGGVPLGHAWDAEGSLIVCVGAVGLVRVGMDGSTEVVASQTKRSRTRLIDDSTIRFADDLDVAPDGAVFFSDMSVRRGQAEFELEMSNRRPEGRVVRYDPSDGSCETVLKNYPSPNGIATAHDGQSILINSSLHFRIDRLWISGPKQGTLEPFAVDLPGYPDNINRSSDGNYWVAFVAIRTPVSDLLFKHPRVRHRMTRELPTDDWVTIHANVSCVAKFDEAGQLLSTWWDASMTRHQAITSVKEQDGYLYMGEVFNNSIGRLKLPPAEVGPIDAQAVPGLQRATRVPVP